MQTEGFKRRFLKKKKVKAVFLEFVPDILMQQHKQKQDISLHIKKTHVK